jgi:ribosomal protein S18 acetylase RimI-like enzyme
LAEHEKLCGVIREGQLADVGLLPDIELEAGRLFPVGRIPQPDSTYPVPALELAAKQGLLFVVEADGRVVGFATCSRLPDRLHLEELSVHPAHGRQGYGRALVKRVLEAAQEQGLAGVSLTTFADIPWNGPFYESIGFHTVPEAELDESLESALAHERDLGLTERIAMIYSTGKGEGG